MLRTVGIAAICAVFAAITAPAARAQTTAAVADGGLDLRLFRPSVDNKGHMSVNGTDIIGHNSFSFGLTLDAGIGILPYRVFDEDSDTGAIDAVFGDRIVEQMLTGTLQFNWGIKNWAVVGLQVPLSVLRGPNATAFIDENTAWFNDVDRTDANEAPGLSAQHVGDIELHAKVRLMRVETDPLGIALILRGYIPTGAEDRFLGEPGFTLWPSAVFEVRPRERIRLSAELGYRAVFGDGADFAVDGATCPSGTGTLASGRPCDLSVPMASAVDAVLVEPGSPLTYDDLLTFGIGASFRATDSFDIVLESFGSQIASEFGNDGAFSLEAGLGLKIFVQEHSFLLLGGSFGIPTGGFQQADYRGIFSIVFEPSIGDRDGDGLKDDVDQCPDDPEDFDDFEDEDGCPEPDNDRDGILDVDDECPMVPEDRDGDADEDGCPEGGAGDRDGDGLNDDIDQCPDDPEDRDGFEDEDGCPEIDNDQDGLLDTEDLCPNDPEDIDAFNDDDGCPDLDNDQDRIPDLDDQCPDEPETYNGSEDEDGCPDRGSVVIEDNQIIILDKIYFETNSAVIQRRSYPILDAVAATLSGNPQITLIEVQGHADERGNDNYNLGLTRDRAASVVDALVQRGVDQSRLRSAGYGEHCPVDPAHTRDAWERNRRVEFKIVETVDGPTGVEVACPAGAHLVPE